MAIQDLALTGRDAADPATTSLRHLRESVVAQDLELT
jgi:hypothetical protein